MNPQGVGGFEGGPPLFDLAASARQAAARSGTSDSHYLPWIGAEPGTHVGRASDGRVYVSQGGNLNEFC